jgi:hypothetical protein
MRRRSIPLLLLLAAVLLAAAPALAQRSAAESEVAFAYGVRAFNHGDWDEAVRLLQEAVATDPDNREAREWLALAQRRQSEHAGSGEAVAGPGFAGLLALRDQPRFDFRAGAVYGKDSNPAELPDNAVAFGSKFGTLSGEVDDKVTGLDLRAGVYPVYGGGSRDPRRGWSLGLTGQAKSSRFSDLDFLNERQWSAAVHLAWGSDPAGYLTGPLGYTRVPFGNSRVSVLLQAGRTDTRLDGDPLVTADAGALALMFRETVSTATQVELDFQKQELLDGLADSRVRSAGASQLFYLGRRDRYLRLGGAREKQTDGLLGDSTALAGTAELSLPLAGRGSLQLAVSRRKEDFDAAGVRPGFTDTTTRAAGALAWEVVRHLYVIGRASWTKRDSDLVPVTADPLDFRDFRRSTASLGLQWLW